MAKPWPLRLPEAQLALLHQRRLERLVGIHGDRQHDHDRRAHFIVHGAPQVGGIRQLALLCCHVLNRHRLVLESLRQELGRQLGMPEQDRHGAAEQAVLVLGLGGPGRKDVMHVEPHRGPALQHLAVRGLFDRPLRLGLPQLAVLPHVVQEEVQRWAAEPRRPLAPGLVEVDAHFAVLHRQLAHQELPQCFVQIVKHGVNILCTAVPALAGCFRPAGLCGRHRLDDSRAKAAEVLEELARGKAAEQRMPAFHIRRLLELLQVFNEDQATRHDLLMPQPDQRRRPTIVEYGLVKDRQPGPEGPRLRPGTQGASW